MRAKRNGPGKLPPLRRWRHGMGMFRQVLSLNRNSCYSLSVAFALFHSLYFPRRVLRFIYPMRVHERVK